MFAEINKTYNGEPTQIANDLLSLFLQKGKRQPPTTTHIIMKTANVKCEMSFFCFLDFQMSERAKIHQSKDALSRIPMFCG
jgi:hypothetical protein